MEDINIEETIDKLDDNGNDDVTSDDNDKYKQIFYDQGDLEVYGLLDKKQRNKLIIQPDFQRKFVWDIPKCSRLIESAVLNIPIPIIFFSEEKDGVVHVIDGQQRLTAFFNFIEDKKINGTDYRLRGLKVLGKELNGKKFGELSEETQDKIKYCKLKTITFKKECYENLKYEIFERLNTGSVPLKPQEIRNCVYRGKYNNLLCEIAAYKEFTEILPFKEIPEPRMRDIELVLRFAALYHNLEDYKGGMKKFLNNDMERYVDINDEDAISIKQAFKNALLINRSLFGDLPFRRNKELTAIFNVNLYDVLMVSFARVDKRIVYPHLDSIREAWLDLISTEEFISTIDSNTTDAKNLFLRFNSWKRRLDDILNNEEKNPRCFSFALKKEMYDTNSICKICENNINDIDDAAVDHIDQYWLGGKTIPENARLAHRFCNNSRPRIE